MKTRKLLITLLIVVLLAVYYILGTDYMKQSDEHDVLASQINEATRTLAQMPEPPDDLEPRLAAVRDNLDAARNSFPDRMSSTGIVNTILKLADSTGVKAIPLVTQPWITESIVDYDYSVFRLNLAITGTFAQLEGFLRELENGELQTLIVEDLSVAKVTEHSEEGSVAEGTIPINASLNLAIYTQSLTFD